MGIGILIGVVAFWKFYPSQLNFLPWIILHLILLIPTVIQPYLQHKIFKIFARTILGYCSASYFLSGISITNLYVNIWIFRFSLLIAFAVVFMVLKTLRSKKINDPCVECPLGRYPVCEWNMPRLLADSEQKIIFQNFLKEIK